VPPSATIGSPFVSNVMAVGPVRFSMSRSKSNPAGYSTLLWSIGYR